MAIKAGSTSISYKDNTPEILKALTRAKARGLEAIGLAAEGHAKDQLYPGHGQDTGRLKNSISHAVAGDDAYIGTNVEYAPYVELGTRNGTPGYHYLQKAATEHGDEYKKLMEGSMQNA